LGSVYREWIDKEKVSIWPGEVNITTNKPVDVLGSIAFWIRKIDFEVNDTKTLSVEEVRSERKKISTCC